VSLSLLIIERSIGSSVLAAVLEILWAGGGEGVSWGLSVVARRSEKLMFMKS
jgi:hypothetical protein